MRWQRRSWVLSARSEHTYSRPTRSVAYLVLAIFLMQVTLAEMAWSAAVAGHLSALRVAPLARLAFEPNPAASAARSPVEELRHLLGTARSAATPASALAAIDAAEAIADTQLATRASKRRGSSGQAARLGAAQSFARMRALASAPGDPAARAELDALLSAALAGTRPAVPSSSGPIALPLRAAAVHKVTSAAPETGSGDSLQRTQGAPVPAAASSPPGPADLLDGVDAEQCPAVTAQASALGGNPVAIYEFVRHTIEYEPYYGLRRGSCETLQALAGNSFDQASLLIAMLRASGIPARFATGTVEVPAARAAGLLGVDDADLASTMIQTGAIPGLSIVDGGGQVISVRMERAWVRAHVPFGNYRGASVDATGLAWVPLDPSFKQFTVTPPLDVATAAGFDIPSFNATIAGASTVDPLTGQVVGTDESVLDAEVQTVAQDLNAYLDATYGVDQATAADVFGSKVVVDERFGVLPASLPYEVVQQATEAPDLPAALRYQLTIQVAGASYTAPMAALAGRRLTVAYPPSGAGGPPGTIFDVIPSIRLDGVAVATGGVVSMGDPVAVQLDYIAPNQSVEQVFNTREAGEVLAIVLDLGRMSRDALVEADAALSAATVELDRIEWWLTAQGRNYFAQLDANLAVSAVLTDIVFLHEVFGAIVSQSNNTLTVFGVPTGTEFAGVNIDVDRQLLTPFSRSGDPNAPRTFLLNAGLTSSGMEHSGFNQLLDLPAVSTTQILQLANAAGVPVYRIDSANSGTILPLLSHDAATLSAIGSEIASGRVVTIPRDPVVYFDWAGTGYVTEDPTSGAAGFIISGGLNGYITTTAGGDIAENLACVGAIIQIVDIIPIPGKVGVIFDVLAVPSGLYDISRSDVSGWRKTAAIGFVFFSLLGIIGAIPTPQTMAIGFLADFLAYASVWFLLGGGNPLDPCLSSKTRREGSLDAGLVFA